MTPAITILPPGPVDERLHYDQEQFGNKRSHAINVTFGAPERARIVQSEEPPFITTGISFGDYGRMRTIRRKACYKDTPSYVFDDAQVREVILRYLERRFYLPYGTGTNAERLVLINKTIASRLNRTERVLNSLLDRQQTVKQRVIQNVDTRVCLERRNLAELIAQVIYMKYRSGRDSVAIAKATGIKPPAVRILLWRLRNVCKDWQAGKPRKARPVRKRDTKLSRFWNPDRLSEAAGLRRQGKSWAQVGRAFGLKPGSMWRVVKVYGLRNVPKCPVRHG